MAEAHSRGLLEQLRVLVEPGLELRVGRPMRRRHVLGEELHLLRHAAADDLVVLVEPQREPLAIKNLLLDLGLDQPVELRWCRLAAPLGLEHRREPGQLIEGQDDLPRWRRPGRSRRRRRLGLLGRRVRRTRRLEDTVGAEQEGADQEELNQRFTQQSRQRHPHASDRRGQAAGYPIAQKMADSRRTGMLPPSLEP